MDAARVIGDSKMNIYFRDILPNSFSPVMVQATLDMGNVVLIGATLSFIGLAEAGIAEWGVLVSEGQAGIASGRWWASTFPGLMVFLWALSFNLVGDGLRDVLDPRNGVRGDVRRTGRAAGRREDARNHRVGQRSSGLFQLQARHHPFGRRRELRHP